MRVPRVLKPLSLVVLFLILGVGMTWWVPERAAGAEDQASRAARADTESSAGYYTLEDESGRVLLRTGLLVSSGDRFLAPDNREYEVIKVSGRLATARLVRAVSIGGSQEAFAGALETGGGLPERWRLWARSDSPSAGRNLIGIYHTHSDESYEPTSGETNKPWNGDIFKVGLAMSQVLRDIGIRVIHSSRRHDPHDGLAYERSRRTALSLTKSGPDAVLDVHRDTPPPEVYATMVNGQEVTSILLVLGRENPSLQVNEKFAYALKDYADSNFPNLVRGIFYGQADYNQDLHPRALLLEVGSAFNSLQEAQRGARFFSQVLPGVLYGTGPGVAKRSGAESRSGWTTALWVILLVVVVSGIFLLMNERNWQGVSERLRGFFSREFFGRATGGGVTQDSVGPADPGGAHTTTDAAEPGVGGDKPPDQP